MDYILTAAKYSTVLVAASLVLVYIYQSSLLYPSSLPPGSRTNVLTPSDFHETNWEDIYLKTPDGLSIHAYIIYASSRASSFTLLYCHANAGNMGHRIPIALQLKRVCNCNVVLFSYRGYGKSDGTPSEKGLKIDADTIMEYIKKNEKLKDTSVVVYGQSLGGAVATYVAHKYGKSLKGLILENTFLSVPKIIPAVLPYLQYFTFLCHQIWDSEKLIAEVPDSIPVMFLSGLKDELVPPSHMKGLFETTKKARSVNSVSKFGKNGLKSDVHGVRFVTFESGSHNDMPLQE
ncbi:hypothetical protein HK098_006842, partial [Nowakowskiella sp. JEL0407]